MWGILLSARSRFERVVEWIFAAGPRGVAMQMWPCERGGRELDALDMVQASWSRCMSWREATNFVRLRKRQGNN